MEKELKKYMQNGLMLYDYILINLLHTLSLLQIQQLNSHYNSLQIVLFGLFINLGWYFIAVALRLYNIESLFINNWNIVKVLLALFLFGLSALLFLVLLKIPLVNRVQLVPYYLLLIVLIFLSRFLYQVVKYFLFKQSGFLNNTLIIGYNNTSKKLAEYLQNSVGALKLVGYVDEPENIKELSVLPVFSGIANTINIAKQYGINEIYSTITPEEHSFCTQRFSFY
jgi:putative colanic acid biosynthesis UDP-glucose lipid carrier transferase